MTARAYARWTMPTLNAALGLRQQGLSYPAIAIVLTDYHGMQVGPQAVRTMLRKHGAAPHPKRVNLDGLRRGTA
jgi:hypothetical protein